MTPCYANDGNAGYTTRTRGIRVNIQACCNRSLTSYLLSVPDMKLAAKPATVRRQPSHRPFNLPLFNDRRLGFDHCLVRPFRSPVRTEMFGHVTRHDRPPMFIVDGRCAGTTTRTVHDRAGTPSVLYASIQGNDAVCPSLLSRRSRLIIRSLQGTVLLARNPLAVSTHRTGLRRTGSCQDQHTQAHSLN